ncbi:MAG TPA: hypothetical protein VFJ82_12615 [Longimicrobium sp.]|nr:hypothetical protein [Longimicrobium sp.]
MNAQRAFIALACAALLGACGDKDADDGGETTTVAVPAAAPVAAPVTPPSDTTMAGMAGDSMMHDSMAHDTMKHDTAAK